MPLFCRRNFLVCILLYFDTVYMEIYPTPCTCKTCVTISQYWLRLWVGAEYPTHIRHQASTWYLFPAKKHNYSTSRKLDSPSKVCFDLVCFTIYHRDIVGTNFVLPVIVPVGRNSPWDKSLNYTSWELEAARLDVKLFVEYWPFIAEVLLNKMCIDLYFAAFHFTEIIEVFQIAPYRNPSSCKWEIPGRLMTYRHREPGRQRSRYCHIIK